MYKKVYLEITNVCNLACPFCIQNQRTPKFMEPEEFHHILEKLKGHTKYLYFHLLGEPLLHPRINEYINYASKFYSINITTNGYLIEKIKHQKNIRQLNLSLHSFHPNNKKTLDEYLKDIFDAVDTLKETTYISFRLWAKTKYKNQIIKNLESHFNCKIEGRDKKNITLEKNVFLNQEEEFIWPEILSTMVVENKNRSCLALKDHIGILVDGTVVPCCLDASGCISLGNILEKTLEEIIRHERYQKMKTGFRENKRVEELCRKCTGIHQKSSLQSLDVVESKK